MTQSDDCKHCLTGIGELKGQLMILNGSIMKIFYALIALAGASVGTKFIGTPWYIDIAMHATMFSAIFVGLITVAKRKCLSRWEKFIRVTFVTYCAYITTLRIFHYQTGTALTQNEGAIANLLITTLAIGFIGLAWRRDSQRRDGKRRYDDSKV